MRTSILSRSIAVAAALAAGSVTLAAVPATAATPSGITRDTVLTAANGIRASYSSGDEPSAPTTKAVRAIVNRGCAVDADGGEFLDRENLDFVAVQGGSSADGLVAGGLIINILTGATRWCLVGAAASTEPGFTLTGGATLSTTTSAGDQTPSATTQLSGDVAVTPPLVSVDGFSGLPTLTASGAATRTTAIPAKTVKDKKTKKEKKAAKAKYDKRLKGAKKAYVKALKQAGGSEAKRAAAKKAYSAARQSAKVKYRYDTANYRIVKKATTTTDARPFTLALLTL